MNHCSSKTLQLIRKLISFLLRYSCSERFSDILLWPVSHHLFSNYSEVVEIRASKSAFSAKFFLELYGDMQDMVNKSLLFMSGYKRLAWEPVTARFVEKIAAKKRVCVVAGSHIGYYPLIVSSVNPSSQIYAFEPNPQNYERFVKNISLNNSKNISAIPAALGDTNTSQKMYFDYGQSSFIASNRKHAGEGDVAVSTLDTFLNGKVSEKDTVDLILLDAEGYEPNILKGAQQTLQKYTPEIIFEINPKTLAAANSSTKELCDFLLHIGYSIFIIEDDYGHLLDVKKFNDIRLTPYAGSLPVGVSFVNAFATMKPSQYSEFL